MSLTCLRPAQGHGRRHVLSRLKAGLRHDRCNGICAFHMPLTCVCYIGMLFWKVQRADPSANVSYDYFRSKN